MNNNMELNDIDLDAQETTTNAKVYDAGTSTVSDESPANSDENNNENNVGFSAKWSNTIRKVHAPILAAIQAVTQTAAKNPKRTVSFITVLSLFLIVVGLLTNFTVDVDEDSLWTPSGANALKHMDWIDDESGFPESTDDIMLFFHANGDNVLGKDEVTHIFEAFDAILGVEGYDKACSESDYINSDGEKTCEIDGVVKFWGFDSATFEAEVSTDEEAIAAMSALEFPDQTPVNEQSVFGKPERDSSGTLTFAQSYVVNVKMPPTDASEDFEDDVLDILLDMRDAWAADSSISLSMEVMGAGSFGDEFERAIVNDLPLLPLVFLIMSIFTALVFFKRDKVRSRSALGFGAVVGVLFSLASSFGFLFLCAAPFTSMTQLIPFVIFGIGLDDAFIIMGAYNRTSPSDDTLDRIRTTIDQVGISITLTSVTSALAFGLGCLSTIPAIFWLCMYAFPTVLFVYCYSLTFFIACIVLDENRIQNNRRDCCCCITANPQENEEGEQNNNNAAADASQETTQNLMDRIMGSYAEFLLKPVVKVIVILVFIALAVVCGLSASELRQSFDFTDVMPDGSYVTDFFDAMEEYTVRSSVAPFAYFRYVDQADSGIQSQMDAFVADLVAMEAVEGQEPENFWLWDFRQYVEDQGLEADTFTEQLDKFLAESVYFDLYSGDIVRDADGKITSSRVQLNFDGVDIEDVRDQVDTLDDQRSVSARQPINQGKKDWRFFTYDGIYNIWSFFEKTPEELRMTTIFGVVSVTAIALVLVPHYTAALFVLPLICVLYVDLLGFMQWLGVNVDPVSYIGLILSIGLLVDFIMHVLLAYYESPGDRREKTVTMLKTMGSSVFIGGISTFLGTIPLAFSTSAIFYTVFVAFLGLVLLGIGHGLILLPVILSLVGPEDTVEVGQGNSDKEMSSTVRTNTEVQV